MKQIIIMFIMLWAGTVCAETYKIGMVPWAGFSPVNVAQVKGFWKDQGLDVKVINFNVAREEHNALIYKRIHFAHEMIGTWIGYRMEEFPITFLAETGWSHGGDKIIAKKDADMSRLKEKPVGIYSAGPAILYFLDRYLSDNHLSLSDVRLIELEEEGLADNFIAGRFQVIVNYDPQAFRAEQEGNGRVMATSASYQGCIPEGITGRRDVLKDIPKQDLVKILKGWIKAVKWIKDRNNWEEYKQILNSKTFEYDRQPYSDESLRKMIDGVRIHDVKMLKERNKDGGGLIRFLEELRTMLKANDMLKKDFSPEEIFDNTAIIEALKDYQ